jgi:hypothetical protein
MERGSFKVTVFHDGYKRAERDFWPQENEVWAMWDQSEEEMILHHSWIAFLEKDEKSAIRPDTQQQQQQIIIERPEAVSYLSVSSDPSDAEVYLDCNRIGTTPINNMKLNPGNYRLKVMKGSKTWERGILLPEEGSLNIQAKPE